MSTDPSQIFVMLLRVFGDGDSLPQQQQQFYSYRQKEGKDLVSCSLALVKIFDRMVQLDPTFFSRTRHSTEELTGRGST